jgi:N-acetylglutamate synthase-like GNAT family acetyltransferase
MRLTVEQFNPYEPDAITLVAAQLIVSEAFGGKDTVEACLNSLMEINTNGHALVANDTKVVGALTLRHENNWTNVIGIAVPEAERNNGYGKLLLRYAAVQALDQGSQGMFLIPLTPERNSFFARFGFEDDTSDNANMYTTPLSVLTAKA